MRPARHHGVVLLLACLVAAGSWMAGAAGSSTGVLARDAAVARRAGPSPCGRTMLTIFLGMVTQGEAYLKHLRPPGVPLSAAEGAKSPQVAARVVALSTGFGRSSCEAATSSFFASDLEVLAGFAALGGKNGFTGLQKMWDALPPAKKKAIEQLILDGKLLTRSSQTVKSVHVLSVRVLSRSRDAAKVAVATRIVEAVTGSGAGSGGPTTVSGTFTYTYLVSLIHGHWYVSALTNLAA